VKVCLILTIFGDCLIDFLCLHFVVQLLLEICFSAIARAIAEFRAKKSQNINDGETDKNIYAVEDDDNDEQVWFCFFSGQFLRFI
jgi:hypothetical protein